MTSRVKDKFQNRPEPNRASPQLRTSINRDTARVGERSRTVSPEQQFTGSKGVGKPRGSM